jgi:hypothetical protein
MRCVSSASTSAAISKFCPARDAELPSMEGVRRAGRSARGGQVGADAEHEVAVRGAVARSGPGWRSRPAGLGGWYCVVGGARFGPWSDRRTAENVMKVEQRRKAA